MLIIFSSIDLKKQLSEKQFQNHEEIVVLVYFVICFYFIIIEYDCTIVLNDNFLMTR